MKIGIDTFSFHIALAAGEYDIFRTLDWLEDQGFAGLQININGPDDKFLGADHSDTDHLKRVRSAIEQKGFFVEIGGRRTSPEMLRWQLQLCADLGADTLRTLVVLKDDLTSTFAQTKRDMDAILPFAESLNVKIALENHEDITASELRQFLDTIPHSYLGACVDTGNDLIVYGDPLEAAQQLAPRAALLHVLVDQRSVATRPPAPPARRLQGRRIARRRFPSALLLRHPDLSERRVSRTRHRHDSPRARTRPAVLALL